MSRRNEQDAMSGGCCRRTTAPSAARRTRLRRRQPSRPCARWRRSGPAGREQGCGRCGRCAVTARRSPRSWPCRRASSIRSVWAAQLALVAAMAAACLLAGECAERLPARVGRAGGGDGARGPARPAVERLPPRGRARVRLPLRLPGSRARAARRAGLRRRGDGHGHRARRARSCWVPTCSPRSCMHAPPTSSRARARSCWCAAARRRRRCRSPAPGRCSWRPAPTRLFTLVPPAYAQGSAWAWALVAAGSACVGLPRGARLAWGHSGRLGHARGRREPTMDEGANSHGADH